MKVFVLTKKSTYRRHVKIFIRNIHGKYSSKTVTFTTEHLVNKDNRHKPVAKQKAAQYITTDENEIKALLSDTGYGKDFVLIDDPKGEKKLPNRSISDTDHKMMALKNTFNSMGLAFDETKAPEVLQEELNIYVQSHAGAPKSVSPPAPIEVEKVDVAADINARIAKVKADYFARTGKNLPVMSHQDSIAVIGALELDPEFDVDKFLAPKETSPEVESKGEPGESDPTPESDEARKVRLHKEYFEATGKNVATAKSNDFAWIEKKIAEAIEA